MGKTKILVNNSLVEGECAIQYIYCINFSYLKLLLVIILSILSLGFILLIMFWMVLLQRKMLYSFCDLENASHFLIKNWDNSFTIVKIKNIKNEQSSSKKKTFLNCLPKCVI